MAHRCRTTASFQTAWDKAERKSYELSGDGVGHLMTTWGDMSHNVLLADEHYRRAERLRLLGEAGVEDAVRRGRRHNEAALGLLRDELPPMIQDLRQSLNDRGAGDIGPFVEIFRGTARDQIADTDISLHDAEEATRGLEDVIGTTERGVDAVCDRLLQTGGDLITHREEREQHNSVVAGLIIVGAALLIALAMFSCAPPGGPTCSSPGFMVFVFLVCIAAFALLI